MSTFRNVSRLRFRHLELLRQLERRGSLRAAAAALNQTQSALSKSLKEAESVLGGALFERTRRGLRPRPEGRAAMRGAALLLAELAHLQEEVEASRGAADAVLRIGAPPFVALGILPPVLGRLLKRVPPVHVRLTEERVPRLYDELLAGRLDALVSTTLAEPTEAQAARLRYEKLFDGRIVVIAPARHALAHRRAVAWAELARQTWILPGRDAFLRRVAEDMFVRAGVLAPRPAVESTNPLTNVRLVAAGLGLALVPAPAAREAERDGSVRRVAASPPIPTAPVALITRGEANPRVQLLREALSP